VRAVVIANGLPPSAALAAEVCAGAALLVAADGGSRAALALGIQRDAVVGDLDSQTDETRAAFSSLFVHDPDPDRTDLQKAIDLAITRGARAIDVLGAGGERADHALANLSALVLYRGRARVRIIDELFEISLIEGEARIDAPSGTVVSLIALRPAEAVTTRGLRWDLDRFPLAFNPYGVHNEVAASPATVTAEGGDVLLFKGRFVEHHA
jgi:thiamine pyrophosphokinase